MRRGPLLSSEFDRIFNFRARLESLGRDSLADDETDTKKHLSPREDETYAKLVDCIKIHKQALG